jgi:hypothetical protein
MTDLERIKEVRQGLIKHIVLAFLACVIVTAIIWDAPARVAMVVFQSEQEEKY